MTTCGARLAITWEAPASCNMPRPCPYCGNEFGRRAKPPLSRSPEEWLAAFAWLQSLHSPFYITVCYGEPFSDEGCVQVLSSLSVGNTVALYSNLLAPPATLRIAEVVNVNIHASYHPDYWGTPDRFLAQVQRYRDRGFAVCNAVVVAFPPSLSSLPMWTRQLREAGLATTVNLFNGVWNGSHYPEAYTADELSLIGHGHTPLPEPESDTSGRLKYCAAGAETIFIRYDGQILQCYMYDSLVLGDIFERRLELLTTRMPCRRPYCPCPAPVDFR